ncbi:MAG: hypothetical protein L6420_00670 [Elusimicrobia bacterium]|nr:hypothetical protein [Patescibacteria group bacterium]MCG2724762.1 hypothetical protein [Elusimicrobiota bacterium]
MDISKRKKIISFIVLAALAAHLYAGLSFIKISAPTYDETVHLCKFDKVLFAISVTNLQSVYYTNKDTFNWLKNIKPVFRAGYSIFLYDLTNDKDGISRIAEFFGKGENSKAECLLKRHKI